MALFIMSTSHKAKESVLKIIEYFQPLAIHEVSELFDHTLYVVLALFMLMGITQKTTLRSYFSKKYILATPIFGSIIIGLNQSILCISKTMIIKEHTRD